MLKSSNIRIIILLCLFASANSGFSYCPSFLKKLREIIQYKEINKYIKMKTEYFYYLKIHQARTLSINRKTSKRSIRFKRFLETDTELSSNQRKLIDLYWKEVHQPNLITSYAKEIYKRAYRKIINSGDLAAINKIKTIGRLDKKVVHEIILNDLINKEVGFTGVVEVTETLSPRNFAEILSQGKLILDKNFNGMVHGEFIHIYQFSLMKFIAQKNKIPVSTVKEIYDWLSSIERINLDKDTTFSPGHDGWVALFDSIENDLTNPTKLNPLLQSIFY